MCRSKRCLEVVYISSLLKRKTSLCFADIFNDVWQSCSINRVGQFCSVCWAILHNRNELYYEKMGHSVDGILCWSDMLFKEGGVSKGKKDEYRGWKKPTNRRIKINMI